MIINVRPLQGEFDGWHPIKEDLQADLFWDINTSIKTFCGQQFWHLGHVNNFVDDLKYN